MRALMISLDRGLLGRSQLGDVVERHKIYGSFVESLDIIVFSQAGFAENKISENVIAIPTNSKNKFGYYFDSIKLGRKICQTKKIDLIVTHEPFITGLVGYRLKKKFKAKILIHLHGDYLFNSYWFKEQKFYYLFLMPLAKYLIRRADALRVMSAGIKEKVEKLGVPVEKIKIINTPVDVKKFENPDLDNVKKIKNKFGGKKIVLFVGRLEIVKDLPTLFKAFKLANDNYPNSVLIVVGDGSLRSELQAVSRKLQIPVEFVGRLDHKELADYYHACNLVALSSLSESFGKIILEAAGAKKPVVATRVTGTIETIKDGETGYLAPVGDSQKLGERMLKVLQSDALEKKLGGQAFDYLTQKFNWEKNLKAVGGLWKELI